LSEKGRLFAAPRQEFQAPQLSNSCKNAFPDVRQCKIVWASYCSLNVDYIIFNYSRNTRKKGGQKTRWVDSVLKFSGLSMLQALRLAPDRVGWKVAFHRAND